MSESPMHGFRGDAVVPPPRPKGLTVCITREAGGRGEDIADTVGQRLGWQVYSRESLDHLVRDAEGRKELLADLAPDVVAWVDSRMQSLLQRSKLAANTSATETARLLYTIAARGEAVIVGRGAGFILPAETTLHVQIVAPQADRVAYLADWLRSTPDEAKVEVTARDVARIKFLKLFTDGDPDSPLGYDIVLNSARLGVEACATLIETAVRERHNDPSSYEFELPEMA
ncbi:cytidylate kinase-like family protein [soil metagenome]